MDIIVDKENTGIRIDKYISTREDFSRVAIQRMIDNGKILVNGKIVKTGTQELAEEIEESGYEKYKKANE